VVKSYSDNIEKDFYLKEISKLLDINTKIVYDLFNRTKLTSPKISEEGEKNINISSEDIAIGYILLDSAHQEFFQENLAFKE